MSIKTAVLLILVLFPWQASAAPSFTGKLALLGHYYGEQSDQDQGGQAALTQLAFAELRVQLGILRLWQERLDLRLDFRLRVTSNFDFESKFDPTVADPSEIASRVAARGYLGGPEYELRELAARLRASSRITLLLGRQVVPEADSLKFDGARLLILGGPHWEGSLYAGGYPNPYSRSLLTDYTAPCGDGVARGLGPVSVPMLNMLLQLAVDRCSPVTVGAAAGGFTAKFTYPRAWGSLGLAITPFADPGTMAVAAVAAPYSASSGMASEPNNRPRIFLSWLGMFRPIDRIDLLSNLVWDLYGSYGMQLTRLVLLGTARLAPDNRVTLRLGYTNLSSLALSIYLYNFLYSRTNALATVSSGIIENNLAILRTARHEARAALETKVIARLVLFVDGRFRYRSLLDDSGLTQYQGIPQPGDAAANLAGDVAVGLRDGGSIKNIAVGLSYLYVADFRSRNHVIQATVERDFWHERLGLSLGYYLVLVSELGAGLSCTLAQPFTPGCFGRRTGQNHEVGGQLTIRATAAFLFLIDYRLTLLQTAAIGNQPVPDLIGHTLLVHAEHRF